MKLIITIVILCISTLGFGQKQIMVKNQKLEVIGVKDGNAVQKETRNLMVKLNYETGDIEMGFSMKDVRLISSDNMPIEDNLNDAYKITGRLPLNDILYNKNTDQNYTIELNINNNGNINSVLFNCDIKNYTGSGKGFRQFFMSTDINLPEDSEEKYGYESKVKVIISFQMFVIGG
ncbi:hypothetical protein ACFLRY_00470 [Bacteroidota bacterium]